MGRLVLLAVLAACGRSGFDPDSMTSDGAVDAADSGLVLHFTFDTAVTADSSSHGHDATCTTCPVAVTGRIGTGAASFDGTECLDIPDAIDLRPIEFTAALWANLSPQPSAVEQMFTHPEDGATTANNSFEMFYNTVTTQLIVAAANTNAVTPYVGGWHHIALVYDGASVSLYVDGVAKLQPVPAGAILYGSDPLHIGCDLNSGVEQNFYFGLLDDVRLYDRALSQPEVAALAAQ